MLLTFRNWPEPRLKRRAAEPNSPKSAASLDMRFSNGSMRECLPLELAKSQNSPAFPRISFGQIFGRSRFPKRQQALRRLRQPRPPHDRVASFPPWHHQRRLTRSDHVDSDCDHWLVVSVNRQGEIGWTPEVMDQLRVLWMEECSTAEIGRQMRRSKNSVVGKAHRMALPARPSPISRCGEPALPKIKRAPKTTLPVVIRGSTGQATPNRVTPMARVAPPGRHRLPLEGVTLAGVTKPISAVRRVGKVLECQWPEGTPGKPGFRFCCADSVAGRSYCPEHCNRA